MNTKKHIPKILTLLLMTILAFGTTSLLASPDDDERGNRNDDRGNSTETDRGRSGEQGLSLIHI